VAFHGISRPRKSPGQESPYFMEILMRSTYMLAVALVMGCNIASAGMPVVDMSRPDTLPIKLMAQFYRVEMSEIKVDSITFNKAGDEAKVIASAPDGHQCVMEVAKATTSEGPVGWMVASLNCNPD
jgi:hypothetical protein